MPLVPTEHLLHKSTPQGLEVTADLSPICKQTKRGNQSGETKKPAPNETTGEISRKELNKTEASNLSDIEFKVMVIRMQHEKRLRHHKKNTSQKCRIQYLN